MPQHLNVRIYKVGTQIHVPQNYILIEIQPRGFQARTLGTLSHKIQMILWQKIRLLFIVLIINHFVKHDSYALVLDPFHWIFIIKLINCGLGIS